LVVEYLENKYGKENIGHIATFGLMRSNNAVKNTARVLGHPYEIGEELAKLLLPPVHGKPQPLQLSYEKIPKLKGYYEGNGAYGEILRKAEHFEGLVNSIGTHPSGFVISDKPLAESVPIFLDKEGQITVQWEMGNLEKAGYIKFDLLGLNTLTKIHTCLALIKQRHNQIIDIEAIDRDDLKVYKNLQKGDTQGIFQLETSAGLRDLLIQMCPVDIEDLAAIVAIFRPGPLNCPEELKYYLEVRAGRAEPQYLVPELKPILSPTNGWLIYQEQVIRIARDLAGYSLVEADDLRRICSKKKEKDMLKHEGKFKDGCISKGIPLDKADILWTQIKAFAEYSFNKSHAVAYAVLAYQTAWLKTYYPVEYMCAIMSCDMNDTDQIIRYLSECQRMGLKVLPPDINLSERYFTIDGDGAIRFGIAPVRNIGEGVVNNVLNERASGGAFTSLKDFCDRIDLSIVNKLKLDSLVKAGAFDTLGSNRASMVAYIEQVIEHKKQLRSHKTKHETYLSKIEVYNKRKDDVENRRLSPEGKLLKMIKCPVEPIQPAVPSMPSIPEFTDAELQQFERSLLGFYVTSHPLDSFELRSFYGGAYTIEAFKQWPGNIEVSLPALIAFKKEITTSKSKQKMAQLILEDKTGQIEAVVFPKQFTKYERFLEKDIPLLVEGKLESKETENGSTCNLIVMALEPLENRLLKKEAKRRTIDVPLEISVAQLNKFLHLARDHKGEVFKYQLTIVLASGQKLSVSKGISLSLSRDMILARLNE
jgi:DNA polymerase-3 subunit alpha